MAEFCHKRKLWSNIKVIHKVRIRLFGHIRDEISKNRGKSTLGFKGT
jgi:hypothetical protein